METINYIINAVRSFAETGLGRVLVKIFMLAVQLMLVKAGFNILIRITAWIIYRRRVRKTNRKKAKAANRAINRILKQERASLRAASGKERAEIRKDIRSMKRMKRENRDAADKADPNVKIWCPDMTSLQMAAESAHTAMPFGSDGWTWDSGNFHHLNAMEIARVMREEGERSMKVSTEAARQAAGWAENMCGIDNEFGCGFHAASGTDTGFGSNDFVGCGSFGSNDFGNNFGGFDSFGGCGGMF